MTPDELLQRLLDEGVQLCSIIGQPLVCGKSGLPAPALSGDPFL
jgi:hypothetical protein